LTRTEEPIAGLDGLLSWIACIGDALPARRYAALLEASAFEVTDIKDRGSALVEMVRDIQSRLLAAEVMAGLGKVDLARVDFATAKQFAQAAVAAIRDGKIGYVSIVARKA
jgi:hypothetical protein